MAGVRAGLLSRNRRDVVRHAAREQDALGADGARRGHRHHVDRRDDVAHPRLRPVAARLDQPARPRHDHRPEVRARCSFSSRQELPRSGAAAEPDAWRTPRRSSATARRSRSSTSGSARRATAAVAHLLRPRAHAAGRRSSARPRTGRRSTSPRSKPGRVFSQAEVDHRRPVVLLGNSPWKALFPNTDPIGKTVRIGSDAVHRHRRPRPAAEPGRSRRRRRFRDHSVRHAREDLRQGAEGLGQDHRRQLQPRRCSARR